MKNVSGLLSSLKKYTWLSILAPAIFFLITAQPSSLNFLNDDFNSIPFYSHHDFTFGGSTRVFAALSIYIDYLLYGTYAPGYIVTNVIIHIACCFVGFAWCNQMSKSLKVEVPKPVWLAGILLFMWFGLHSETILWTICRTASLGLLGFLGTWLCILRVGKSKIWIVLAFICVAAGITSYEVLLLLPFQLICWYLLLSVKENKKIRLFPALIMCCVAIALFLGFKYYLNHTLTKGYGASTFSEFNIVSLSKNYISLVFRTFSPPLANKWAVIGIGAVSFFILVIISFKIIITKRVNKWWKFLLFNWLLSYVLFASLGIDLSGNESDRYIYIPSFFFCNWLVYSIYLLQMPDKVKYIVFSILLICHISFFILSVHRFQLAGKLANKTLVTIGAKLQELPLVIENLPAKAYGIPVLRMGSINGLKWFYPLIDTSKIRIRSELEIGVSTNEMTRSFSYEKYYDTLQNGYVIKFFPVSFQ